MYNLHAALALLLSMAWLMRRLGAPRFIAGAITLVFALSPNFLVYRNWLFYTLPVALMLVAVGLSLDLYSENGRRLPLTAFGVITLAAMMTRSTFHPLWLIVVVLALLPFFDRRKRRGLVIASLAPLLAVSLWFVNEPLLAIWVACLASTLAGRFRSEA